VGLEETFASTLLHELGHTKNRLHAPCNGAAGPDPAFPNPPGGLGGAAFDGAAVATLDDRTHFDLMGYCYPRVLGAYTYKALLAFFLADAQAQALPGTPVPSKLALNVAEPVAQTCLAVSGLIQDGAVTLDPAEEIQAIPETPEPGTFTLSLLDAEGNVLLEVPFEPQEVADDESVRSFALLVPLTPALQAQLAGLRATSPGSTAVMAARTDASSAREPVALAWGAGQVNVSWDPGAYPLALVRDPATGKVLANADGGRALVDSTAGELEILMSDGVRTTTRRMVVH
jgi:hypothetical protein